MGEKRLDDDPMVDGKRGFTRPWSTEPERHVAAGPVDPAQPWIDAGLPGGEP